MVFKKISEASKLIITVEKCLRIFLVSNTCTECGRK